MKRLAMGVCAIAICCGGCGNDSPVKSTDGGAQTQGSEAGTVDGVAVGSDADSPNNGFDAGADPADVTSGRPGTGSDGSTGGLDAAMPPDDGGAPPPSDGGTIPSDDSGTPVASCASGQMLCPQTPFNNESPSNFICTTPINSQCPAPDLIVVSDLLADDGDGNTLGMSLQTFASTDAEVVEGCVNGIGMRRLLRFNFGALNQGDQNMDMGRPNEADPVHWEFFVPHNHWHVKGWGDYRLHTIAGQEVAHGHKQSFCLEDNIRVSDTAGPRQFAPPLCENFDPNTPYDERPEFGLSQGWGDEYPSDVRCQWIDLGSATLGDADYLPDGIYDLAVSVNMQSDGSHLYRENDYDNNTAHLRVQITGTTAVPCVGNAGEACATGTVRCDGSCG